jgi:hypothetical protein
MTPHGTVRHRSDPAALVITVVSACIGFGMLCLVVMGVALDSGPAPVAGAPSAPVVAPAHERIILPD